MLIYSGEKMSIEIIENKEKFKIDFIGVFDDADPEKKYYSILEDLYRKAMIKEKKTIELDCMKMDFLNSSGIKVLIKWISLVSNGSNENMVNVNVLCNSKITWQLTSLNILSIFAPKIVKIELI